MYPPDGSPNSLPRLRLRSMYAEKPEDNLLFQVSVLVECCDGRIVFAKCVSSVVIASDNATPFWVLGGPQCFSCLRFMRSLCGLVLSLKCARVVSAQCTMCSTRHDW
jgi:hypothetical protein